MNAPSESRLAHLPIGVFSTTMGLFGAALAFHAAGLNSVSTALTFFASLVLIGLLALYGLKALRHPAAVVAEWQNPVKLAFFPAISISLMLAATALRPFAPDLAAPLWIIGAVGQAGLTIAVIASWIGHRGFGAGQLSPAWFIPAVGNVVAPLGGIPLGFAEASWYFFATGLLFWIVLLTLVFNRLVFHEPLPGKLRPTIAILIAPPAVAALAWLQLNGGSLDPLARILVNLGLFFTALTLSQIPGLLRLPFALSFWALSFPVASMSAASFRVAALSGSAFYTALGWVMLAALTLILAGLVWRTLVAIKRNQICVPEA